MEEICKNCNYAFKRCDFSYKKNGHYECSWECLKNIDYEMYKKDDETCKDFAKRTSLERQ